MARIYQSELREQAKAETRERIVAAVVKVILDEGVHAFTVQNVADKAGVSHRTVYRHFATREDLLDALSDWLHASVLEAGLPPPTEISAVSAHVGPLFEQFARMRDAMRASVIAAVALGYQTGSQRRSSSAFEEMAERAFPHLPREEVHDAAAVLRTLVSRYAWYVLDVDLKVESARAARGVTWAVATLVQDLKRRDEAARRKR